MTTCLICFIFFLLQVCDYKNTKLFHLALVTSLILTIFATSDTPPTDARGWCGAATQVHMPAVKGDLFSLDIQRLYASGATASPAGYGRKMNLAKP